MRQLQSLEIESCHEFIEVPQIQENMERLVNLSLRNTGIKVLPLWIREHCTNLVKLNLSRNKFTRLDSSLLQLTRLKILNLTDCRRLVGFPELPSSVAILKAPLCESPTDSLKNCKCVRQVSITDRGSISDYGITNHANRVIVREYMLQGEAIENGTMVFTIEGGLALARAFVAYLLNGDKCRLERPENWRNKFSGFLFCVVGNMLFSVRAINVEQVMSGSMNFQPEVDWKESDDDRKINTWVGCVSFALLRESPWWDQTYNHLLFSINNEFSWISGFGVGLIPKSSERGNSDFSQISNNLPYLYINHMSQNPSRIIFPRSW